MASSDELAKEVDKGFSGVLDWLKGKKTYIVAILIAGIGIATAFGVEIPESVWPILSALGLGAVRAGVNKK